MSYNRHSVLFVLKRISFIKMVKMCVSTISGTVSPLSTGYNSVTDWIMSDGAMHFGVYGKQRGWVRAGFSQGIPDKADSDGFIEIPKQMELEIPFK